MALESAGVAARARRRRRGGLLREEAAWGWLLQIPNIVGLLVFAAGPLIASLVMIFMNWQIITPPTYAGLANFNTLVSDPLFAKALYNTVYVTVISVPLYMALGLLLALALNQKLRGMAIYRVIFFLPSQMPAVANAILWLWLFNPDYGLVNWFLGIFHIPPSTWVQDPLMAKPALIIMGVWTIGASMIIFLAGLQNVPQEMHEAAAIDGATAWRRFLNITLPLLSPVIFFSLIIGIINTMQSGFTTTYLFTGAQAGSGSTDSGGPDNALLLMFLYIYHQGFVDFNMGYASLLAWALCIIILALTMINFKLAGRWVYYEGQLKG
jgi:multiple sugar transport system permease protein